MTLLYDASFEGFLTTVFDIYNQKLSEVRIRKLNSGEIDLWGDTMHIITDAQKAARIWEGIIKRTSETAARNLYCSYLSELPEEEDNMLNFMRYIFSSSEDVSNDFSHPAVYRVAKIAKMVGREKHRMEAFVRFELMDNEIFYAHIEPDFNVLPLILKHFKSRYADQKWLIADLKRNYGIYYDLETVHILFDADLNTLTNSGETGGDYQRLWKTYFKSTNITERRNMKLHLQHVPMRYWKYLSEKQP